MGWLDSRLTAAVQTRFAEGRLTFRTFIEDPEIVQRPDLVVRYKDQ